jgi:hypothetical protein
MDKDKKRAERRHHSERKQKARYEMWAEVGWDASEDPRQFGKLRDTHFGCGCVLCKPHKHGLDEKFTPSERRRLQTEE